MPKVKVHAIPKEERYRIVGEFFDSVSQLKTKQEIIDFFVGLLTSSESLMLARRIQIAKLLIEEKGYEEIRRELKNSYQTITRIERWLHERDGAYKKILKKNFTKIDKENTKKAKKAEGQYTYESLLDRYPGHRFMKEILGMD